MLVFIRAEVLVTEKIEETIRKGIFRPGAASLSPRPDPILLSRDFAPAEQHLRAKCSLIQPKQMRCYNMSNRPCIPLRTGN